MKKQLKTLLVEDNLQDANLIQRMLFHVEGQTFHLEQVGRLSEGLERLEEERFDLILLDLQLPDSRGVGTFTALQKRVPHLPIIVLTGFDDEELAAQAMQAGAQDYLVKSEMNSALLDRALRYAVERKRAAEALRESEERFRMTIQRSPIGVGIVDSEGNLTDCNAALAKMVGYSREELLRLNFADFTHPDDLAREWQLIDLLWEERTAEYRMEKRYVHKDGHTIWVDVAASLFKDEQGELAFGFAFVQDITKRKKNELALQRYADQQAALYAVTAAASSSLIRDEMLSSVLDEALAVTSADVGWVTLLDPTGEAQHYVAASRGVSRSVLGQEIPRLLSDYQPHLSGMTTGEAHIEVEEIIEAQLLPPEVWAALDLHESHSIPLTAYGQVLGFLHLARRDPGTPLAIDEPLLTTMGKQIGLALRNAQLYREARKVDRLRAVHEIAAAVISSLEMDQVLHQILEMTSRALNAAEGSILLRTPGQGGLQFVMTLRDQTQSLRGMRIGAGEGIAGWVANHEQAVYVNEVKEDPRFYQKIDDVTGFQTHTLICAPLKHQGEIMGVIEFVNKRVGRFDDEDLSLLEAVASIAAVALKNVRLYEDLKQLLREREQSQAQMIHNARITALGRLMASIAHEINNPLQAVRGYVSLAQENLKIPEYAGRLERYLDIVSEEVERISDILNRMREFYRPGRQGFWSVRVESVIEKVLALTRKELEHHEITVEFSVSDAVPSIEANADQLKQVFLNLVLNAVDAMPEGGKLSILVALEEEPMNERGRSMVRIEFTDTGIGMSQDVMAQLFEPFITTKQEGSGLGMSISYDIIQAHHGSIAVQSKEGEGATFTVHLPLEQPDCEGPGHDHALRTGRVNRRM